MSHELSIRKNGKAEMAYVGEVPWHGLGSQLEKGASLEQWAEAAGLDWKLNRSRVRFGEGPNQQVMDSRHVLFRSDTKLPLSVVGKDYKIVQPAHILEFFRDLTTDMGFVLDTAGALFDGKRLWAQALTGQVATIGGADEIRGRLLLSTSCDGTMATTARYVNERVVCFNTLSMALSEKTKHAVKIHHSSRFDAGAVKAQLGIAGPQFRDFVDAAKKMAKRRVTNQAAEDFVAKLLVDSKTVTSTKVDPSELVRESAAFQKIMNLFKGSAMGGTLVTAEGSAWGALNAVTEYVDHHSNAQTASSRMDRAWFGVGDRLKTLALESAQAI